MKQTCTWIALAVLTAGSLLGCEHEQPKPPPPAPVANPIPQSRQAATGVLTDHARKFSDYVAQMPGVGGGEHRRLLVGALTELSWVLRAANGAEESPEFANQIAVIDSAAQTASIPSLPRSGWWRLKTRRCMPPQTRWMKLPHGICSTMTSSNR